MTVGDPHRVTGLVDAYLRRQGPVNRLLKDPVLGQVYCQQEALQKRRIFNKVSPLFLWEVMAWTVRRARFLFGRKKSWVWIVGFSSAIPASFETRHAYN